MFKDKITNTYAGTIILINVIAYFIFITLGLILNTTNPEKLISLVALKPLLILEGRNLWTLLTHMFMHAGFTHLLVNMISLLFIGNFVEKLIGKKRFIWLYFGGGLSAALLFIIIAGITGQGLNTFAVGASGAIFALGGLLAVLTPKLPVLVFFVIPMPMWMAMAFLLGVMWVISITLSVPIGNVAHLGGLLAGLGYGFYIKKNTQEKLK